MPFFSLAAPLILTDGPLGSEEIATTLGAFLADNEELADNERADIAETLAAGRIYYGDEGAGGQWTLRPMLRPGERMVAGRPYIFDLDALNDWHACQAKIDCPSDLATLTDDEITNLSGWAIRIGNLSSGRDMDLCWRMSVERTRRGLDAAYRGKAA